MAENRPTLLIDSQPAARAAAALEHGIEQAGFRTFFSCTRAAANANNLVVFSTASHLERVAGCVSTANKEHRLAALIVFNDISPNWLPYILHRASLRTLRNTLVHSDDQLPTRILNAWAIGAEHDLIADAAVIADRLVIRTCSFDELSLAFEAFSSLRAMPVEDRGRFEIDPEGYFLHWPDADVHLDVSDVRFASNPEAGRAAQVETLRYNTALGATFKRLREEAGLKQDQIPGLSDRHVRRVETGSYLSLESVEAFARALTVSVDDLLESLGNSLVVKEPVRRPIRGVQARERPALAPIASLAQSVAGHLQLAADSAASDLQEWSFSIPSGGALSGVLQHHLVDDLLEFIIRTVPASLSSGMVRLVGTTKTAQQFSSEAFAPQTGLRIPLAKGLGILPGDIATLDLGPAE